MMPVNKKIEAVADSPATFLLYHIPESSMLSNVTRVAMMSIPAKDAFTEGLMEAQAYITEKNKVQSISCPMGHDYSQVEEKLKTIIEDQVKQWDTKNKPPTI